MKITSEELKRSLQYCINNDGNCKKCVFYEYYCFDLNCVDKLLEYAFERIKELEAKLEDDLK